MTPETTTQPGDSKPPVLLAHVLLLLVTLVWGSTFPLVKAALHDIPPLLFNFLRMLLAFAVLAALHARHLRGVRPGELRLSALAGLFLGLGYELQTVGLTRTTPTKSAFITGLVVVLVPLLSFVPGVRPKSTPRPSLFILGGALLAFAGLVLLTTPSSALTTSSSALTTPPSAALLSGLHLGEWLTLGGALAYAGHLLTLARAAQTVDARRLGTLQIGFAALLMLVGLPLGGRPVFHLTHVAVAALLITSLLATAAAFTIQSWTQRFLPASHTALLLTMEPVFAWLTSLLFLGERLGTRGLIGAGLILFGILLAELLTQGEPALLRSAGSVSFAGE